MSRSSRLRCWSAEWETPVISSVILLGSGYSGTGIVEDFLGLREDACAPLLGREWGLIQNPRGILWAESAIYESFHPAKASAALRELAWFLHAAGDGSQARSGASGFGYEEVCPDYRALVSDFLDEISVGDYTFRHNYFFLHGSVPDSGRRRRWQRMLRRDRAQAQEMFLHPLPSPRMVFRSAARRFLAALARGGAGFRSEARLQVLPQAGTFWDPASTLRYFDDAFVIRVSRDPRDHFAELRRKKRFGSVESYVRWRRTCDELARESSGYSERVLDVRFEDFVRNHAAESLRVCDFLGLDPAIGSRFSVGRSTENIGIFRHLLTPSEASRIEEALLTGAEGR